MNVALRLVRSEYLVLILCGALALTLAPFAPGLLSIGNLNNVVANLLPLLVVAVGQTIVLIVGGIDLSATATIALASVIGGMAANMETGWFAGQPFATPLAILLMLLLGAAIGGFNGFAVTKLRMPAFMVTLTTMMFVSGLAIWLTRSKNISGLPTTFTMLGDRIWIVLLVASTLAGFAHFMLAHSLFGRWLHAVGYNARAAFVSGVPVDRVIMGAYVVSGVMAAAASVLYTARLETASPVLGQRMLLDVIGATVIGGTSLFGGKGKVVWTLFGALFLTLLDNGLNLIGLSHFSIMMVKGAVIVLAALLDATRKRLEIRGS
jgi:ribose/xylose/arabinose/galactoside ABC-type transport system permease subunit